MIREFFVGVPASSTAHSQDPIVEKEWDAITVQAEEKGWWQKLKDWWRSLETWEKGTIAGTGVVLGIGIALAATKGKERPKLKGGE